MCRPEILEPQWRPKQAAAWPSPGPAPMQEDGADGEQEVEEVAVLEAQGLTHPAGAQQHTGHALLDALPGGR